MNSVLLRIEEECWSVEVHRAIQSKRRLYGSEPREDHQCSLVMHFLSCRQIVIVIGCSFVANGLSDTLVLLDFLILIVYIENEF